MSVKISIRVKAGSKKGPLIKENDGILTIYVQEQAINGAANNAVIKLLAEHLGVPKSQLQIIRGHTSSYKIISY